MQEDKTDNNQVDYSTRPSSGLQKMADFTGRMSGISLFRKLIIAEINWFSIREDEIFRRCQTFARIKISKPLYLELKTV